MPGGKNLTELLLPQGSDSASDSDSFNSGGSDSDYGDDNVYKPEYNTGVEETDGHAAAAAGPAAGPAVEEGDEYIAIDDLYKVGETEFGGREQSSVAVRVQPPESDKYKDLIDKLGDTGPDEIKQFVWQLYKSPDDSTKIAKKATSFILNSGFYAVAMEGLFSFGALTWAIFNEQGKSSNASASLACCVPCNASGQPIGDDDGNDNYYDDDSTNAKAAGVSTAATTSAGIYSTVFMVSALCFMGGEYLRRKKTEAVVKSLEDGSDRDDINGNRNRKLLDKYLRNRINEVITKTTETDRAFIIPSDHTLSLLIARVPEILEFFNLTIIDMVRGGLSLAGARIADSIGDYPFNGIGVMAKIGEMLTGDPKEQEVDSNDDLLALTFSREVAKEALKIKQLAELIKQVKSEENPKSHSGVGSITSSAQLESLMSIVKDRLLSLYDNDYRDFAADGELESPTAAGTLSEEHLSQMDELDIAFAIRCPEKAKEAQKIFDEKQKNTQLGRIETLEGQVQRLMEQRVPALDADGVVRT